jgi:hypothetical protein
MMLTIAILGFGLFILVSGRCPISGSFGLKGTGARLAGVAVIAWGLHAFNFIALPVSGLFGGMETTGGILAFFGTPLAIIGLVIGGLVAIFGNAYAAGPRLMTKSK